MVVNDSGLGALSRLSLPFTFLHLCSCCGRGLGSIPRRLWCVGHLDGHPPGLFLVEGSDSVKLVVGIEAFIKKFPCITSSINKKYFSFSGEAKDSAIFAFYFLLHKRANPLLPPYPLPPLRARTQTLYSPLTYSLTLTARTQTFTPSLPSPSAHPSAHWLFSGL